MMQGLIEIRRWAVTLSSFLVLLKNEVQAKHSRQVVTCVGSSGSIIESSTKITISQARDQQQKQWTEVMFTRNVIIDKSDPF